jgi:hypothetical protein
VTKAPEGNPVPNTANEAPAWTGFGLSVICPPAVTVNVVEAVCGLSPVVVAVAVYVPLVVTLGTWSVTLNDPVVPFVVVDT